MIFASQTMVRPIQNLTFLKVEQLSVNHRDHMDAFVYCIDPLHAQDYFESLRLLMKQQVPCTGVAYLVGNARPDVSAQNEDSIFQNQQLDSLEVCSTKNYSNLFRHVCMCASYLHHRRFPFNSI